MLGGACRDGNEGMISRYPEHFCVCVFFLFFIFYFFFVFDDKR